MKCEEIQNLYDLFEDKELNLECRVQIEIHLAQCIVCQQFYRMQKEYIKILGENSEKRVLSSKWWQSEKLVIKEAFRSSQKHLIMAKPGFILRIKQYLPVWKSLLWPKPSYYVGMVIVWFGLLIVNKSIECSDSKALLTSNFTCEKIAVFVKQKSELTEFLSTNEWEFPKILSKSEQPNTGWKTKTKDSI